MKTPKEDTLLGLLKRVDTPTVCNAIEVAQGCRGFNNFTHQTMLSSDPGAPAMVGYARTATIAALAEPTESTDVLKARRMNYFRHMASGTTPKISVVQDLDEPHCVGAWWGEVHTAVHKGLGVLGAVTNGLMRDLGDIEPGFPVLAGGIGPSHAFVHVRELGVPVNIFGLRINDGDLLHADRHGALVIPEDVLPSLFNAINTLLDTESLILEPARQPDFDLQKLEQAWAAFERART